MRLGIFDPDAVQPYRSYGAERIDTPAHRQLALEAANQVGGWTYVWTDACMDE